MKNKSTIRILILAVILIAITFSISFKVSERNAIHAIETCTNEYYLQGWAISIRQPNLTSKMLGLYWIFQFEHERVFDQTVWVQVSLIGEIKNPTTETFEKWKKKKSNKSSDPT